MNGWRSKLIVAVMLGGVSPLSLAVNQWMTHAETVEHIDIQKGGDVFIKMAVFEDLVDPNCTNQAVHKLSKYHPDRLELLALLLMAHATRTPVKLLIDDVCGSGGYQVIDAAVSQVP